MTMLVYFILGYLFFVGMFLLYYNLNPLAILTVVLLSIKWESFLLVILRKMEINSEVLSFLDGTKNLYEILAFTIGWLIAVVLFKFFDKTIGYSIFGVLGSRETFLGKK